MEYDFIAAIGAQDRLSLREGEAMATVLRPERSPMSGDRRQPASAEVTQQLERILASPAFPASARRKALLRFLVTETLGGRAAQLKGFSIAVAVFGRDDTFDPQTDPVVRLEARRLRRDLDSYYAAAGGDDAVRISIPKGAYVPYFELQGDDRPSDHPPEAFPNGPDAPGTASTGSAPPEGTGDAAVPGRGWRYRAVAALAGIAILVVTAGVWLLSRHIHQDADTATVARQEHGATVIVLPFDALSAKTDDKFLAIGLSERLISDLMRFAGLKLYSVPASLTQSPHANPVDVGRDLPVAYVVRGSVRSGAGIVEINAQLVDAKTGQVLWSATYAPPMTPDSLLHVQREVAARIATRLGEPYGVVREMTADRFAKNVPQTMAAYACVLEAYAYRRTFARDIYAPVRACLANAVRSDPGYADAWALLGWVHLDGARFGYVPEADVAGEMDQAYAAAQSAIDLAPQGLVSLQALSAVTYYRGEYDRSERLQRQALALNPLDPETLAQLGWRLALRGRWDEGLGYLTDAIGRTIDPPPWYFFSFAVHDYIVGDYAKALVAAEKAKRDEFGGGWSLVAIIEAALGHPQEAAKALTEMAARSPPLARDPAAWYRFHRVDEAIVARLVDGLRKAGLVTHRGGSAGE